MLLVGVVVKRYIDFLILLIPTPLVSVLFCSSIPTFCSLKKKFFNIIVHRRPHACIRCDIQQARTCLCESQTT